MGGGNNTVLSQQTLKWEKQTVYIFQYVYDLTYGTDYQHSGAIGIVLSARIIEMWVHDFDDDFENVLKTQ